MTKTFTKPLDPNNLYAAGGGRLNTRLWTERRKKDERREDTGMLCRARIRVNLGGGERRGPEPSRTGIHRNLNIGTESRETQADVRGTGNNHPIMDKLGVPEAGPKERKKERKKDNLWKE